MIFVDEAQISIPKAFGTKSKTNPKCSTDNTDSFLCSSLLQDIFLLCFYHLLFNI